MVFPLARTLRAPASETANSVRAAVAGLPYDNTAAKLDGVSASADGKPTAGQAGESFDGRSNVTPALFSGALRYMESSPVNLNSVPDAKCHIRCHL